MKLKLTEIANALGTNISFDGVATGYSIDSRTLQPGDLFFALRGPSHDGHDYLAAAFDRGAVAAVVDRDVAGDVIRTGDSLAALQHVGAWARLRWGGEVIGITGSAGKTTTKDAIAAMLAVKYQVGKTTGNLNNHIGVPLSLLRVPDEATHAVIEMGMNHAGEIRDLARMARPQTGVVTNVGHAHIENFDSIEGVAAAKRELIEELPPSGTAVLNADDQLVSAFPHPGRRVSFGIDHEADVRATAIRSSESGVQFQAGGVDFESALPGRHGVSNLLAAIATAGVYGIRPDELTGAVKAFAPPNMRGRQFEKGGIFIFDDCYNANPDAVRAMLDVLRDFPAKRRIAVLGEMLELGRWAEPLHRDVGLYAAMSGISVLVGIRGVARWMVDAAIQGGLQNAAFFLDTPEQAGDLLKTIAQPGDAILFKGSRGTHVELALQRFLS